MLCTKSQNKILSSAALTAALLIGTPTVFAHTGISALPVAPKDGQGTYLTNLTVTHGCSPLKEGQTPPSPPPPQKPVVAVSVVFPNSATAVATKINPDSSTENVTDLSQYIDGAVGTGLPTLSPNLIQDGSVFSINREITEGTNVRAFNWTGGAMKSKLYAYLPFRLTVPKFVTTSCVTKLLIRAAAADYCTKSQSTDVDSRADIWYGVPTTRFTDADIQPEGYYPTLTVERDKEKNPLPEACGEGYQIAVQPSIEDVDKYLPISGFWPASAP